MLTHHGLASIPPRSGGAHARALLDALAAAPRADRDGEAAPGPDLGDALDLLARGSRRRGVAVVVSDFPGTAGWVPGLRAVAARHETLAVEVLDPRELDLPDVGLLVVADPETGEQREVRTSDAGLRRRYAEAARAQRQATAATMRALAVDHVVLRTDRDADRRPRRLDRPAPPPPRPPAPPARARHRTRRSVMRFLVEWRLFLLVGVGALAGAWVAAAVRRRRDVVRFTNVELLDVIAAS